MSETVDTEKLCNGVIHHNDGHKTLIDDFVLVSWYP